MDRLPSSLRTPGGHARYEGSWRPTAASSASLPPAALTLGPGVLPAGCWAGHGGRPAPDEFFRPRGVGPRQCRHFLGRHGWGCCCRQLDGASQGCCGTPSVAEAASLPCPPPERKNQTVIFFQPAHTAASVVRPLVRLRARVSERVGAGAACGPVPGWRGDRDSGHTARCHAGLSLTLEGLRPPPLTRSPRPPLQLDRGRRRLGRPGGLSRRAACLGGDSAAVLRGVAARRLPRPPAGRRRRPPAGEADAAEAEPAAGGCRSRPSGPGQTFTGDSPGCAGTL